MPDLFVTSVIGKDYREGKARRFEGRTVTTILEDVYKRVFADRTSFIKSYYLSGGSYSSSVRSVSGRLRSKTTSYVARTGGGGVTGRIVFGEGVPYAGMHIDNISQGHDITPKSKEFLAIPLPRALTSKGQLIARFRGFSSLKEVKSLHPIKGTLAEVDKSGKVTPYFALKRMVHVPVKIRSDKIMEDVQQDIQQTLALAFRGIDFTTLRSGTRD